jgi:hypothetical protein
MRGLLQRDRKQKTPRAVSSSSRRSAAPVIPKALQARVGQRLQQISSEQEQEKKTLLQLQHNTTDDSEDSENSLLQANQSIFPADADDDAAEEMLQRPGSSSSSVTAAVNIDESSRLLQTIGSDLSDAPYFEQDESSSSYDTGSSSPLTPGVTPSPRSLLGRDHDHAALVPLPGDDVDYAASRSYYEPATRPRSWPSPEGNTVVPTPFSVGATAKRLLTASLSTTLLVCCLLQLYTFPTVWLPWLSSALSIYCSTFFWPLSRAPPPEEAALREERQSLVAGGLPYKSRLLVAQAQVHRLQERVHKLQALHGLQQAHRKAKQEAALAVTLQVLLKSNRTPATTHLNALTLSVLPVKLAAVGVQTNRPVLFALAQSRQGSRAILMALFRDLLAPAHEATIFRYESLAAAVAAHQKEKQTAKASKKGQRGGLRNALKRRSHRTENI